LLHLRWKTQPEKKPRRLAGLSIHRADRGRSDFRTAGAVGEGDAIRSVAGEPFDGDAAAGHTHDLGVAKTFVAGGGTCFA
jgi:hypothetical protein